MEVGEYYAMSEVENSHWWFLSRFKFLETVFPKNKDLKILDIGAGTGGTTKRMQKYGKVIGIEQNSLAIKLAKKRKIVLHKGSAEKLPFPDYSFDLVIILDVLYHQNIRNDIKALQEAYRVLKPGGILVVTDCAFEFLKGLHDKKVHNRERYTKELLVKRIEKAGFIIERASYIFFFLFPLFILKRLFSKLRLTINPNNEEISDIAPLPDFLNHILLFICSLENYFFKFIDFPFGSTIIIRAKKNLAKH